MSFDQHRWQCPHCRANNMPNAPQCFHCGMPNPASLFPAAPTQMAPAAPQQLVYQPPTSVSVGCVTCGNPGVQKVSAICQSGTWTEHSTGTSVGVGQVYRGPAFGTVGVSRNSTVGANQLAMSLAPPPQPVLRLGQNGCGIALLLIFGLGSLANFFSALSDIGAGKPDRWGDALTSGLFAAALLGAGIWVIVDGTRRNARARIDHAQQVHRWQIAMANWDLLYYCSRCDTVYNPYTHQAAPIMAMHSLL